VHIVETNEAPSCGDPHLQFVNVTAYFRRAVMFEVALYGMNVISEYTEYCRAGAKRIF
jgi:hypothetical protein